MVRSIQKYCSKNQEKNAGKTLPSAIQNKHIQELEKRVANLENLLLPENQED